ncbi:ATP-binding cassette domain-containing protein [Methanothrix soehngenii]|uniref:ATP-binding cassette domain-containing protein n=1 Tax=Methanothrix soehngenii TaxID=2223 RepID=UPI00300CB50B
MRPRDNVSKHWTTAEGQVRAVDGLSFALDEGTLNVLLGPSGCGKSTTLRLIAGLEQADERAASSSPAATSPTCRRRSAASRWCSSRYALFPHLTVAENILFGLRVRRVPPADTATRLEARRGAARAVAAPRPQAGAALRRTAAARGARAARSSPRRRSA